MSAIYWYMVLVAIHIAPDDCCYDANALLVVGSYETSAGQNCWQRVVADDWHQGTPSPESGIVRVSHTELADFFFR